MWFTITKQFGDKISHKGLLENISNQYKFVRQAIISGASVSKC